MQRFKQEASVIISLEHPHLVPIYDYNVDQDPPYIVMRYLNGGTVADVIKERQVIPLSEIAHILNQVAGALEHAHNKGIIHRDIKPSNIMIDKDGNAFLTDFGIARISGATGMTATSMSVGTPGYMSPEQGQGEPVDHRTDIYALGVMVFEMATGHPPYTSGDPFSLMLAHITKPIPSSKEFNPQLPPDFDTIIQRAIAKNPADRYESAMVLAHDIELLAGGRAIAAATPAMLKRIAADSAIASDTSHPIASAVPGSGAQRSATTRMASGQGESNRSLLTMGLIAVVVVALMLAVGLFLATQGGDNTAEQTQTAVAVAQVALEGTQQAIAEQQSLTETAQADIDNVTATANSISGQQTATQIVINADSSATAERSNLIATNTALALTDQASILILTDQANSRSTQDAITTEQVRNAQATNVQMTVEAQAVSTQSTINTQAAATQAIETANAQSTAAAATSNAQATNTQQAFDEQATATQSVIDNQATQTAEIIQQAAANETATQNARDVQATEERAIEATANTQLTAVIAGTQTAVAQATNVQATVDRQLTVIAASANTQAAIDSAATRMAVPYRH